MAVKVKRLKDKGICPGCRATNYSNLIQEGWKPTIAIYQISVGDEDSSISMTLCESCLTQLHAEIEIAKK